MLEARATGNGACPYCGHQDRVLAQAQPNHPQKTALVCGSCGRHSTEFNGRRYPHDDPSDPLSPIAVSTRIPTAGS